MSEKGSGPRVFGRSAVVFHLKPKRIPPPEGAFHRKRERHVRLGLSDKAAVIDWVARFGLERVARLLAEVGQGGAIRDDSLFSELAAQVGTERVAEIGRRVISDVGQRGPAEKPDTVMLLKMAHLDRPAPRALHSIAREVVREGYSGRRLESGEKSRVAKLRRHFGRWRHTLRWLAERAPMPTADEIAADCKKVVPEEENRARAGLLKLLPSSIDVYDQMIFEAKRRAPELIDGIHRLGRTAVELRITAALREMQAASMVTGLDGVQRTPRDLLAMIEPDLPILLKSKSAARRKRPN